MKWGRCPRHVTGSYFLHGGLVPGAPCISECIPGEIHALFRTERFAFPNEAAAPIDHGSEYIEYQRAYLGRLHCCVLLVELMRPIISGGAQRTKKPVDKAAGRIGAD